MNEVEEHLVDDIDRLCHPDANAQHGFLVHLYKLSIPGASFSKRDWSPNSGQLRTTEHIGSLSVGKPVEIFFGVYDCTGKHESGVWLIEQGKISSLS